MGPFGIVQVFGRDECRGIWEVRFPKDYLGVLLYASCMSSSWWTYLGWSKYPQGKSLELGSLRLSGTSNSVGASPSRLFCGPLLL